MRLERIRKHSASRLRPQNGCFEPSSIIANFFTSTSCECVHFIDLLTDLVDLNRLIFPGEVREQSCDSTRMLQLFEVRLVESLAVLCSSFVLDGV